MWVRPGMVAYRNWTFHALNLYWSGRVSVFQPLHASDWMGVVRLVGIRLRLAGLRFLSMACGARKISGEYIEVLVEVARFRGLHHGVREVWRRNKRSAAPEGARQRGCIDNGATRTDGRR